MQTSARRHNHNPRTHLLIAEFDLATFHVHALSIHRQPHIGRCLIMVKSAFSLLFCLLTGQSDVPLGRALFRLGSAHEEVPVFRFGAWLDGEEI